jgi:transcriptional antiterminator RfaH
MDSQKNWLAVYTKPQREIFAQTNLRLRGIETFFPKLALPRTAKRTMRVVALFPSYLFAHCEIGRDLSSVVWCPGVRRVVSFNGSPAVVDDATVEFLMSQTGADGVIASRCNVEVGQHVSIRGGAFNGLIGIIHQPPSARGRVKVLLQILNRQTHVDVPVEFIKASWIVETAT